MLSSRRSVNGVKGAPPFDRTELPVVAHDDTEKSEKAVPRRRPSITRTAAMQLAAFSLGRRPLS